MANIIVIIYEICLAVIQWDLYSNTQ